MKIKNRYAFYFWLTVTLYGSALAILAYSTNTLILSFLMVCITGIGAMGVGKDVTHGN